MVMIVINVMACLILMLLTSDRPVFKLFCLLSYSFILTYFKTRNPGSSWTLVNILHLTKVFPSFFFHLFKRLLCDQASELRY